MTFAERLKLLRKERRLTQEKMAELTGISKSSISMYENGNRIPELETFESLADFFNVNMDYLKGKSDIRGIFDNNTLSPFPLSVDESEILAMYRHAEPHIKQTVRTILESCRSSVKGGTG